MMKIEIKSSRWKHFLLLLCSAGFVVGGGFLVVFSPQKWVGNVLAGS